MTLEELDQLLDELEDTFREDVDSALNETADEFARAVDDATDLVAAVFSVSRVREMWQRHVPGLVDRLRSVARRGRDASADDIGEDVDAGDVDAALSAWEERTTGLLNDVGDELATAARDALAEGVAAGETLDQLKDRMRSVFATSGTQLGPGRAERIATTETTRAYNAGTQAAAEVIAESGTPVVKQWWTRRDSRVREAHADADGQIQLVGDTFDVGGYPMRFPGDPLAPASLTVNCFPGDTRVQVPGVLRRVYRHWYEGPMVHVRTANGMKLSGTPNHPVLTASGWKPLQDLKVGDQLVESGVAEWVGSGDPQVQDVPPTLAEVYRAACELRPVDRVERGRVNFHGDVPHSDVDVVPAIGHLTTDDVPRLSQELGDRFFFGPDLGLRELLGGSHLRPTVGERVGTQALAPAGAAGGVGRECVGGPLFEAEPGHTYPVGFARTSDGDARFFEPAPDDGARDPEVPRDGQFGHSTEVTVHDIVYVDTQAFTGHVFNLETGEGWYSANGITSRNCRCVMRTSAAPTERTASMDGEMADEEDFRSRMPAQLKRYWLLGAGAAKIRWGTPGSFDRCVRELRKDFPQNPQGLCANLYHEATGRWPGQRNSADTEHTGAMIALVPSASDAARLALEGGESAEELHLTLAYLGEAADWPNEYRDEILSAVEGVAADHGPVYGNVFGASHWNPTSDDPAWVWNVGDHRDGDGPHASDVHESVWSALSSYAELPAMPEQHTPWVPHICARYGDGELAELNERTGPVTFDRIRVAFAGEYTDFPLGGDVEAEAYETRDGNVVQVPPGDAPPARIAAWSTPGDTALAFENQQTGDGRVFAPGALRWDEPGPWPLQYADEMLEGHHGAELAGAIHTMAREGDRLTGAGVLYLGREAGREAHELLSEGAPLGVSVDLDDVDMELVSNTDEDRAEAEAEPAFRAHLVHASVMAAEGGGFFLRGQTEPELSAASDQAAVGVTSRRLAFHIGADGRVPAPVAELVAAAGDPDPAHAAVVESQNSGDYLMRITKARVRGATLVTIPAYANARIVLDEAPEVPAEPEVPDAVVAAAAQANDYERVLRHVRRSSNPVGAARVARLLRVPVTAARRYLARAAHDGEVVRLARGLYTDRTTSVRSDHRMDDDRTNDVIESVYASVTGSVSLPVADRNREWDGDAAATRVFDWADGDCDRIGQAFAWRDDDRDCAQKNAYKLGFADVIDGELTIVPRGVFAAQAALAGGRGGVDLPSEDRAAVEERLTKVRTHVDEVSGQSNEDMAASAWQAMQDLPAMPAEWFREPTEEELPPGGTGVNYANGRIFGWVAQAEEPHAGYAKRVVINDLGRIDTSHFLRQRFNLDDGTVVKAGAFTMNAGHHRDGAECETSACQFDDSRTVAGIVTVGMNERGMWFSGAAAPWMSEWDRRVFMATQPSYHMRKGTDGRWQLRAVLSVPVPGHSSPLLASAVVERAQAALVASASMAEIEEVVASENARQRAEDRPVATATVDLVASIDYDRLADALVAATVRAEQRRADEAAELEELLSEGRNMVIDPTVTKGE